MEKNKLMGKIFGIALVFVLIGSMLPLGTFGSQSQVEASPAIIHVVDHYETIQAVKDKANSSCIPYTIDSDKDNYPLVELFEPYGTGGISPWPMFHHDPQRTGRSPHTGPETPSLKWSFGRTGSGDSSPAIGPDGTIYIGSMDNNLYAINPDGTLKWSYNTGGGGYSSPAISSDGTIYIGSRDKKLYAISPEGELKWYYQTNNCVNSDPAIGPDGTIYFGSYDGHLYAINPDSTLKWAYYAGWSCQTPAIAADGTIYVFSGAFSVGEWVKLYALNPDGTLKWSCDTRGVGTCPAIGADGTIYFGCYDGKFYALNPDGTMKWTFSAGDGILPSPAIGSDGTIYFGSSDKRFYALNADGSLKWWRLTEDVIYSSAAIGADGTIYFSSFDGYLYAFKPDSILKWRFQAGRYVYSSPAIGADGTIYVGADAATLYAIGQKQEDVTLTLYVHENSASGPIIVGAQVTGQDGAGNSFSQTTNSNGYVTITGVPGTWSFTASKTGYNANSWSQDITSTCTKHAYLIKQVANVTLTLYVHEGSASGPIIVGAQVTGQDGAGNSFSQTTNSNGYVTVTGVPGTWSFTASKSGYDTNSWSQSITTTCEKHAYLIKQVANVTLTLYVHENSASGPVIAGVRVTGEDGAGNSFDQTTNASGYVTITGAPGTWSFTASKTGYQTNSWSQSITTTGEKHAYLQYEGQIPEQVAACSLSPPTLISPTQGAAEIALRPTFSWSSVSGANRYWLVVATDKNLLPTEPADGFCEVYYIPAAEQGGQGQWGTLLYPAYYNSTVVRLYNFNGKAVIPTQSIVISYEEKVTTGGEKYKEITTAQSFSSYEDAQAYVASHTSGNYRIVGTSPFSSPVPLERLNSDITSVPGAVISEIGLTSTSYTPPSNLDHSTNYWWQVQVFNLDGGKIVQLGQYSAQCSFTTEQEEVALTLYVHENSASGPVIAGVRVTGEDGAGNSFDQTTNASGYVTLTGVAGTWSFTAAKSGYNANSWSQDIASTCTKHAYLTLAKWSNCVITLEQCQSGAYIDPYSPLCWEISGVGVGASFSICVSNSTASNGINEIRFSSDDTQDGVPNGQWTEWYDWNTSSGDWHAGSKYMTWSFATGGQKEIWAEVKDSADQTSQCFSNIAVVSPELPDVVSLDDIQISQLISSLVKYVGTNESWPVFLKGTLPFGDIPINIVLICSENYPTEFKLVRIKTNPIEDSRDLSLSVIMPSSGILGCTKTYVPRLFADWITNFGETLAKTILTKIATKIAGTALGMDLAGIDFLFSVIDCVAGGYETTLEGWEIGKDYLVYLPMGVDLTIRVKRGLSCYAMTSPVLIEEYCPPLVHGQWTGSITESSPDIKIDIEEVDTDIFKLYSPAELRVYDSLGRVTGLVHGEIREEIPDSVYEPEIEVVAIFSPTDVYRCEVVGTEEGDYGLQVTSISKGGGVDILALTDVPTSPNAVHQYTIDWDALAKGEKCVDLKIDSDGDGIFEETKTLRPPIAAFTFSPSNISANKEINFDASQSSDIDGEIVSYQWNFGDGNTTTGQVVTHAYPVPGEYLVSLVVVDNDGVVSTRSVTIQIGERQGMPIWGWAIIAVGIFVLAVIVLRRRRAVKA
jgi:outer membrane protein assembly factor BamB